MVNRRRSVRDNSAQEQCGRRTRRTSHIVKWNNKVCVSARWKQVNRARLRCCPLFQGERAPRLKPGVNHRRYKLSALTLIGTLNARPTFSIRSVLYPTRIHTCIRFYDITGRCMQRGSSGDYRIFNINPAYLEAEIALTETIRVSNNVKPGHEPSLSPLFNFLSVKVKKPGFFQKYLYSRNEELFRSSNLLFLRFWQIIEIVLEHGSLGEEILIIVSYVWLNSLVGREWKFEEEKWKEYRWK